MIKYDVAVFIMHQLFRGNRRSREKPIKKLVRQTNQKQILNSQKLLMWHLRSSTEAKAKNHLKNKWDLLSTTR